MNLKSESFSDHSFPKLFRNYISEDKKLLPFFNLNPFEENSFKKRIESNLYTKDRSQLVSILHDFNRPFNPGPETVKNIESLAESDSFVIVTGQQITLLGGPLFTIYKTLTSITLSKRLSKKYNVKIIPIFWLADEDHDYEEISKLSILDGDELRSATLEKQIQADYRISDFKVGTELSKFKNELFELLPDTDFKSELREFIETSYSDGRNYSEAFASLLMKIFSKNGLVIAGSNSKPVKEFTKSILKISVEKNELVFDTLESTSRSLEEVGYSRQVIVQKSNLFWIDDDGNRKKLIYEDDKWLVDDNSGLSWSSKQLQNRIEEQPNRFSPNVFLRPLIQDELLPSLAYIGGPGEISYYAQMKRFYSVFDKEMPIIVPRFSATIIESSIGRILNKLPFSVFDFSARIEDLESKYINQTDSADLEGLFSEWKSKINRINSEFTPKVGNIDTTLENTAGKAEAVFFTELDKLKGKLYRSVKQQEKTQLDRIEKIKGNLYPGNNLQEREIAFIYYMNKYGLTIWDNLLELFMEESPDSHKLIYL